MKISKQYIQLFRVAVLIMVCMVAGVGSALAQSFTLNAGETRTTAVQVSNPNATVTNNGTITTTGTGSHGIRSTGAEAMISNSGTIATAGNFTSGIVSLGSDATITNALGGTIATTGNNNAEGIRSRGTGATITHSGSISTTGAEAHGIVAEGAGAEITISGSVSATGQGSYAVQGSDAGDQTLTLLPGARLLGGVNLGERANNDNDVVNLHVGRGPSMTYQILGAEEINLLVSDSASVIRDAGDTIAVLDPTGSSAERMALGSAAGQIRRLVFQRLTDTSTGMGASGGTTGGSSWGTFFGGGQERSDDGLAMAWSGHRFGAVGGYDIRRDSSYRVGLFAGGSRRHVETDVRSITTDTNSGFMGAYGQRILGGGWTLSGLVTVGYESHNSDRAVFDNGDETANGDYNSFYANPPLALAWRHKLEGGFEFRPGVQIAYTYGRYSGYTESGTTNSNLRFGSRNVSIFDSRLQLALARSLVGGRGEVEVRGGATFTHYGDDNVGVRLGEGDPVSYRVPGDKTISAGYLGASLRYAVRDAVNLVSDLEYHNDAGGTQSISGYLGLKVRF